MFKQGVVQKQQRRQELRKKLEAEEENDVRPDKRPPNAYLLFCREKRKEQASAAGHDAVFQGKEYAEMWRSLPEDEKRIYQNRAHELLELFRKQNPDFKYKQKKKRAMASKTPNDGNEVDPLQFLNHMFQNNPLLLQQMVLSDRDHQGKPSAYRLFFPE